MKVQAPPPPAQLSPRQWLAMIRSRIPGGQFSYSWLIRELAPFGVVENRTRGDGSHYLLERGKAGHVFAHSVSKRFREEPNLFPFLRDVLDSLRIDYREFFDSLEGK